MAFDSSSVFSFAIVSRASEEMMTISPFICYVNVLKWVHHDQVDTFLFTIASDKH